MIQDIESLKAAQQILCTTAMNNLTDSLNLFTFVQHIDGREPKGRQAIAEQLMDIEDRLLVVKTQVQSIRNLYMEV